MSIQNSLFMDSSLVKLLGSENYFSNHVGYVYSISFTEAYVLTNDAWKAKVNGIPHNSFLIAASFNPEMFSEINEFDKEVVLLRVLGPAPLPSESEIIKTKIEHSQNITKQEFENDIYDGFDPITKNEIQFGALKCRILGTFYEEDGELRLGSDLENYMSSARLKVYKPRGEALEMIVNHINPEIRKKSLEEAKKVGFKGLPTPIDIGTVRYTSTARLHRSNKEKLVPVRIQPSDFLARRTAVFGMTRTGKSNTIKTTVSAVALAAMKDGIKVGQIIFDINGEYANANHQDDGSSIADVFNEECIRYRAIETEGFEDLRLNFYYNPSEALALIQSLYNNEKKSPYSGQDLDTFMNTALEEPDKENISQYYRWRILRSVFLSILYEAGYKVPNNFKIEIPVSNNLISQIKEVIEDVEIPKNLNDAKKGFLNVTPIEAVRWFLIIREANMSLKQMQKGEKKAQLGLKSNKGNSIVDATLEAFLNMLARKNSKDQQFGGYRAIVNYTVYHSNKRKNEVVNEIIKHLYNGKIVILDLSTGPVEVRNVLSEKIATGIFNYAFNIMNSGKTPQNIVIYIEEAHNLIGKKEELTHIWPRIAKEGAKAKIALVYSTQEPSSIHPNILANTENWFVTHLNNEDELKTLGKFYDFSDFHDSLKVAQDVGFARIKSLSSPFVIPTQINKFDPNKIKSKINKIKGRLL